MPRKRWRIFHWRRCYNNSRALRLLWAQYVWPWMMLDQKPHLTSVDTFCTGEYIYTNSKRLNYFDKKGSYNNELLKMLTHRELCQCTAFPLFFFVSFILVPQNYCLISHVLPPLNFSKLVVCQWNKNTPTLFQYLFHIWISEYDPSIDFRVTRFGATRRRGVVLLEGCAVVIDDIEKALVSIW